MKKVILPLVFIFLVWGELFAQFSPGKLSEAHSDLEGVENCTRCHEARKKLSAQKCLSCHQILKNRISSGQGLHSNPDYQQCQKCHVEHLGRDFSLIHWPDGKENFNHEDAKFKLNGKHATLKCEDCHQPRFIQNKASFIGQRKDLKKTFIGLSKSCTSCHMDEHRAQLGNDCLKCHSEDKWKPATKFDHQETQFPLTGKHQKVACEKCHSKITDNKFADNPSYLEFKGIEFGNCQSCHQDVHKGKLGENCQQCHTTRDWGQINQKSFNHDQTSFPLKDKHRLVSCEKCHGNRQKITQLKFQECRDCHTDYHRTEFSERFAKSDCQQCHTEKGFSPALFTVADHQKTYFQLEGAHLAVPCISCHKTVQSNGQETIQFKFTDLSCQSCHVDPHESKSLKISKIEKKTCQECHSVSNWKQVEFDHKQTDFPLQGKHAETECIQCHKPKTVPEERRVIPFGGLSQSCMDCHQDPHGNQFAVPVVIKNRQVNLTRCEKCHTNSSWKNLKFDHNRDSKFKLEGAHSKVSCTSCHPAKTKGEQKIVIYKPLDSRCQSCHGTQKPGRS